MTKGWSDIIYDGNRIYESEKQKLEVTYTDDKFKGYYNIYYENMNTILIVLFILILQVIVFIYKK